jgi:hypothetical protein
MRVHWLLLVGLAMIATLLLLWIGQVAFVWGSQTLDDWKYGRPRTTQVDAFVQHETGKTPSHFIAINLDGHVQIVELSGGSANATKIYQGPSLSGEGAALLPVQIWFEDRNGDRVPDMVIQVGQAQQWYRNDPGQGRFISP